MSAVTESYAEENGTIFKQEHSFVTTLPTHLFLIYERI
jgi:hypothetical protein